MNSDELKARTKRFALSVLALVRRLPKRWDGDILGKQLVRAATSVGANYRAACRARSKAEFISKIAVVEEEADESLFWLELIEESRLLKYEEAAALKNEANELTAIFAASGRTAKGNK